MESTSMTGKQLLQKLRTYQQYEKESDYYIKKAIGVNKLATVDQLKSELIKLQSTEINIPMYLPEDMNLSILLYTKSPETIYNFCTVNTKFIKLCDHSFWINKFNYENIPILINGKSFESWMKMYKLAIHFQCEAKALLRIVKIVRENFGETIPEFTMYAPDLFENNGQMEYTTFEYEKTWSYYRNDKKHIISNEELIYLITKVLMIYDDSVDYNIDVKTRNAIIIYLVEDNYDNLIYSNLKKRKFKKKTIKEKAILSMYELLDSMGQLYNC